MATALRFIDLFAGLGGFHLALSQAGCRCVWACEMKKKLRRLYQLNFPDTPIEGDITEIAADDIPEHDILCAGFPCQPFSLAGKQQGFQDEKKRGNLFLHVCRVMEYHHPTYVLLENVKQLFHHDEGRTWKAIHEHLNQQGYGVAVNILSPHQFGIPQHRERVYIVCRLGRSDEEMQDFRFPQPTTIGTDINDYLNPEETQLRPVLEDKWMTLQLWDEFLRQLYAHDGIIPNHPIWAMEMGATYPYWDSDPRALSPEDLRSFRGTYGQVIKGRTCEECLACLPEYARRPMAVEKRRIIRSNRELYERNKEWMDIWKEKIRHQLPNHQRMEWRLGKRPKEDINIYRHIVQFRSSGVRIRERKYVPTLTCVTTETPFIPWIPVRPDLRQPGEPPCGRYLSLNECARLQGMQDIKWTDETGKPILNLVRSYGALGNAINVDVMALVARAMLEQL